MERVPVILSMTFLYIITVFLCSTQARKTIYRVDLANGNSVETEEYYRKGNTIYYKRHGLFLGVEATAVRRIEPVTASGGEITEKENPAPRKKCVTNHDLEKATHGTVRIETETSHGTGFFISQKGYILTCKKIIQGDQKEIKVILFDNTEWEASLVQVSEKYDLALLKLNSNSLKGTSLALDCGDVAHLLEGDKLYAIGNQIDLATPVTSGILSYYDRKRNVIQTSALINADNSGGPLVTQEGKVIGINTEKLKSPSMDDLNFAIEIDRALKEFSVHLEPQKKQDP